VLTASLRRVIFLLILIMGSWASAPTLGQSPTASGADSEWVAQHLAAAMDSLIPLRGLQYREFVAYRMSPDWDGPESHFAISFPQTTPTVENVEATVSRLTGGAVRSQLLKLHMADRDASLDELMLRVAIRRATLASDRCVALKARVDALEKVVIEISPRSRSGRYAEIPAPHAPVHQIVLSRSGTSINAVLQNPRAALVRWAVGTLNALNKCAGL
jgi:hypothetical protein